MDFDPSVGIQIVKKTRNDYNFDVSLFSNCDFSVTIGFISSIKVVIDSLSTVKTYSDWNVVFFD